MKICVVGLWHLGTVTAACLASGGHQVVGLDFNPEAIRKLQSGVPPLYEPDLAELVQQGISRGCLSFSADASMALAGSDIVWIAYDTPVDEEDRADVEYVVNHAIQLFPYLDKSALMLISSQLPVGTTHRLEVECAKSIPDKAITFGCSPENLRLGKAIAAFTKPDRVVVGLRDLNDRPRIVELLAPFTNNLEWVSVESAEMTKHALNAFLATSVTFINEIASICERVGADAKEVERALKSDVRIGPKAYLSPGAAYAGGTLARDIRFLIEIGAGLNLPAYLFPAIQESNEVHKKWSRQALSYIFPNPSGLKIGVWGLTYKPGTDTLRRSTSIELCQWLNQIGAFPQIHDPAVKALPETLSPRSTFCANPISALEGASALVVATEWPVYRSIDANSVVTSMSKPIVIDPNRFLAETLGCDPRIRYYTVGKGF